MPRGGIWPGYRLVALRQDCDAVFHLFARGSLSGAVQGPDAVANAVDFIAPL